MISKYLPRIISPKSFLYALLTALFIVLASLVFTSTSSVSAATAADCNARGNSAACKQEAADKCGSKSGDEKSKCIEGILSNYPFTGLPGGKAQNCTAEDTSQAERNSKDCLTLLPQVKANETQIQTVLRITFAVAAGVSLFALMIAAFNYATAGTDIEKVTRSKRAIIFALVGLVVAMAAEILVLTILDSL